METLTVLKILHTVATVLLLGSVAAVLYRGWRGWKGGEQLPFASTLQRPWVLAWVVMGISLVSFPISGWWLVHTVGWPLGQTWILSAAVLYVVGGIAWLLLLGRVRRLRALGGTDQAALAKSSRNVLIIAGVALVLLLVILGLMIAKPG